MTWLRNLFLPNAASIRASDVDDLFMFVMYLNLFFFFLILGMVVLFVIKYRRKSQTQKTAHIEHNTFLELSWSVIPLILCMVVFFWGFNSYMQATVAPDGAMEIQVTAKKWVWTFGYPDGSVGIGKLWVPVNKPVRMVMHSEDVLHAFYVPAFRVKADVLPNRYTEVWFQATEVGDYVIPCAEYCGKGHSEMRAYVKVVSQQEYEKFLEEGDPDEKGKPPEELGALLYTNFGCSACHSIDGTKGQGPSWKGIYGQQHKMTDGKIITVDENYIRTSILQPQAEVVEGFQPIMPSFQGQIRERQLVALIAYIKSLK
ncbi:cytochrome c oxidase subunit II [Bryobacter aggregatus]|uniref:cytochrome c oxidase subunit II n=1 Tax=Bryobacter aggregatus TaxID=360054 RepID=UPI0004E18D53|nr:cytochrome c oxidase subunit II [Bryobacter aggregatus]